MKIRIPFRRRHWLALLLATATPLFATTLDDNLRDCVVTPQAAPLVDTGAIGNVQDFGNVTVMSLSGDYERGLTAPRQQVAATFYANHPDQYDFLVVFTTFEFPTGNATAFYNSIRNDTAGVGLSAFDFSSGFGSTSGKLQGYIDMAALSRYSFLPTDPQYAFALGTLAHEIQHRWGSYVNFTDAHGQASFDLIGQQGAHWSYFLDTDASVMYGSQWQAQSDGKFLAVDIRHRYSPLDLYLAGLAAPSEVPPFTLIRNGDGGVATDFPLLGASSGGQGETVTIEQIISANGARVPDASRSQKQFTAAFILLTRPGENVSPEVLYELERYRVRFQQEYSQMTNGRGLVRIYTQANYSTGARPPQILIGSGDGGSSNGVAGAVTWLEAQQQVNGDHWQDRPATAVRDTEAVVAALNELDPGFAGLQKARAWLAATSAAANLDQRAWHLRGTRSADDVAALSAAQDVHGGFALAPGWQAGAYDTAYVGSALAQIDPNSAAVSAAQGWLSAAQNGDGSFGYTRSGRGRLQPTLYAVTLLSGNTSYSPARDRALSWIATQGGNDGGVGVGGDGTSGSLSDTIETFAAFSSINPDAQFASNVRQYVQRRQQIKGDWNGSVYLTARAALAVAHDQRANLAVDGAITAAPAQPHDGETVQLKATIVNSGNIPTITTVQRWYDGNPDSGGVQIGPDIPLPSIPAQSHQTIAQPWDTTGRAGAHDIWLVLDATDAVTESSESDNRASLAVTVQAPSDLPDLTFTAADFTLTPSAISTLPTTEHVSGVLHNVGNAGVTGALVRVYAKSDLTHALAQTAVDVAGRSSTPIAFDFPVTQAATLDLVVRADPDNAIAEANENNNDVNLTLPFGQSLDLEVTAADLSVLEAVPTTGQAVDFDVVVHNRGTVDSPPATLHADVVQGASTIAIFDSPVQIVAGQSVTRRLSWHPSQPGAAQLRIAIDPANLIAETREDNNSAQLDFTVSAPTAADLTFAINSLAFLPTPALQGQPLSASLTVRNLSSVATGAFRVALYTSDPRGGAAPIGSTLVPGVPGSSDTSITINVADVEISGDQALYAWIDADNAIAETDETNNIVVAPLHIVPLPDLAISVADMSLTPALPVPGQTVQAQVTVRNLGGQDAQDVVVRLLEGDTTNGAPAGADQTLPTLAAGASVVLHWNWTLGLVANSRSVTAIADPDNSVREGIEDNNVAMLPFDVQSGNFFANQRYISPNGDGVQDETAIVFVTANAGPAELDVLNGAQYVVRHFSNVSLNDALRGQVIWDGRDDHGRIVPDGDYHLIAVDAMHRVTNGPLVTVDNNRSSVFEAWDSIYGVSVPLLQDGNDGDQLSAVQAPPAASPLRDQAFGFWSPRSPLGAQRGLYRSDTLLPDGIPVLDAQWVRNYALAQNMAGNVLPELMQFTFSPDGTQIAAGVLGYVNGVRSIGVVTTAADQVDAGRAQVVLPVLDNAFTFQLFAFLDNDTLVFGPGSDGRGRLLQVSTGTVTPWRSLANLSYSTPTPYGLITSNWNSTIGAYRSTFLPRDAAQAAVPLHALQPLEGPNDDTYEDGPDYSYEILLSPQKSVVSIWEMNGATERLDLLDLSSGNRRTLVEIPAQLAPGDRTGRQRAVRRYRATWFEQSDVLLLQDALLRSVTELSEAGEPLTALQVPQTATRLGQYTIQRAADINSYGPEPSMDAQIFPYSGFGVALCDSGLNALSPDERIYDPARDAFLLQFGETVVHEEYNEGYTFRRDLGIQDYDSVNVFSSAVTTAQRFSPTPLVENADTARFPLHQPCDALPYAQSPILILSDGARLRGDGKIQSLSRGLLTHAFSAPPITIDTMWPGENQLLRGATVFNSLLNSKTVLNARTVGRGIELSGVAADRNFAYYKLEWSPIEQNPSVWKSVLAPSSEQVFGDEFLTWVPPQTGTFLIRLTVVDKAGNVTTATASATSFASAAIDTVSIGPRFFSPNGDGVQDVVNAGFRVTVPHTLAIHIDDANGNVVRSAVQTYDNTTLGMHSFAWDGRDNNGQMLADGRYRFYLDDFAAWVTLDTVAPTFTDVTFTQAYQPVKAAGCDGDAATLPLCMETYAGDLPVATATAHDLNPDTSIVEYAPKGGGDWLPYNGNIAFGHYTYRIVATDRAGNRTMLPLGTGEEQLILTHVNNIQAVRYQTPPVTAPLNPTAVLPPILPRGANFDPVEPITFIDESGSLSRVAVETAPLNAPDQWTERHNDDVGAACSDAQFPTTCGELLPADGFSPGDQFLLRIRGDRADGTRVYSNQVYFVAGGIDKPFCFGETLLALEHIDGPLARAEVINDNGQVNAIDEHPGDGTLTFLTHGDPSTQGYVVGVDQHGITYRSPHGSVVCPPARRGDSLGIALALRAFPVVTHDQCDGQPSDQVALGFESYSGDPRDVLVYAPSPSVHGKLTYKDGLSGAEVTLFEGEISDPAPQRFTFSTAGWPEGSYPGTLTLTDPSGMVYQGVTQIPVLKHPPAIDILAPLSGTRMCAPHDKQFPALNALPMTLDVSSPKENAFQIDIGSGASPSSFTCLSGMGGEGLIAPPSPNAGCGSFTRVSDLTNSNLFAKEYVVKNQLGAFNGIATLRLHAVGWSGGAVCTNSTIYLDSDVEFLQRQQPTTILPLNATRTLGVSPSGYPQYLQASMYFSALEPVQVSVNVSQPQQLNPNPHLLQQIDSIEGDVDVTWNGLIDGLQAPDGAYQIDVGATDGCAFQKTLSYSVLVDSTPPAVAFSAPASGTSTSAAVIEFDGSVTDNVQLASWSLDFSTSGTGNWQNIARGTGSISPAGLIGSWSRGSITGTVDVRLSAIDMLGNRSETHLSLTLLTPAKLIGGAELQPALFSPNGDGTLDVTRLQLNLLQNAALAITANGAPVFSGSGAAGTATFAWNGKDATGHALADGNYPIVVNATDPSGLAAPEAVTLTAIVDDTPPTVVVTQPSGPFASASGSVQLTMQDLHFASYDLALTRSADGAVVASGNGTQGGDVTLTTLQGFPDGDYALHAVARDGAGNATTRDATFTLDTTPPSVTLTAPLDAALLGTSKATSVQGSVNDAHLATWTLSVAPANVDTWTDLAHGTANVAAGEILAWTPTLADGSYRLRLRGVDQAGNAAETIHAITLDGTPPIAHIAAPANGAYVRAALEVDGSATDSNFLNYRLSVLAAANLASGQWADVYVGSTPVDNAKLAALSLGLADGDYVLRLTATDKVGLSSSDQVTLHVDDTPPPAPLNLIGHVANGNRDAVLDWNAVGASDLAGYNVYRGGARLTSAPIAAIHYVDAGAPEGHLQYYVTAVDQAGNESAPSNTVALYIDHTPPAVAIVKPQRSERVRGAYPIVGTAYSHDDFKQYRLSLQIPPGGTSTPLASSSLPVQGQTLATWDTSGVADETSVRVHLEAEDTNGNVASVDVDVVVDNGPPAAPTGLTAVLSGANVQANWNPNTESDLLGYLLYRDGNLVNASTSTLPADLRPYAIGPNQYLDPTVPDGSHTYVVYAIDRAGNVSPPSAPATLSPIDNHAPSMTIVAPADFTKFDTNITVYATSPDSDIATVQFAWRAQGATNWTNFGSALTTTPYRVTWTPPQGTPYGNYQIRPLATDLGGRSDPNPPVVTVVYADLTPPDVPTNVQAHADAGTVHVSWNASTATDLAGYFVYRDQFYLVSGNTPLTTLTFDDTNVDDGDYSYTIVAVDKYGNRSDPSSAAPAHVFTLNLAPPYSPTSATTTPIHGSSPQPGTIALHDEGDHGSTDGTGATAADGSIALTGVALALGGNHYTLRVTDANGDISRAAEVWIDRGAAPAAPSGVTAAVADHTVDLSWNANAESDLLGYRVFRNGHVIAGDVVLGETPSATNANTCYNPGAVVDGDAQTYCEGQAYGSGEDTTTSGDPSIELDWTQPRIVTAAQLTWMADYVAVANLDVFAWSGHAWVRVARVRGNATANQTIAFDAPYRTTQIRFVLRGPSATEQQYFQLAEAELIERPVQSATNLAETLIDGTYHYTVTALSAFAFESAPSSDTPAAVGDTHGGGAVELTGTLAGNDATLSWTASPAPNVARYDLKRNGQVVDSIDAAAPRSFVDRGLGDGTYVYVVYAYDALNDASAPSNVVSLSVTGFGPGVPIGLTVTDPRTGGELDTSWQPGGGTAAVSYILRRGTSANGPFALVVQGPDTSYPDSPLVNGTTYYYTVEAVDAAGLTSGQSAPVSGTPSDHLPPDAPLLTYPTSPFGPVTLHVTSTTVCGASDGATVELDRAGRVLGSSPVVANSTTTTFNFVSAKNQVLPAPDGRNVADIASDSIRVLRLDNGVQQQKLPLASRLAAWAQRGDTLYFASAASDMLYRWELGQAVQPLTQPISPLDTFAVSPDETTLAMSGQYGADYGVWLVPVAGGTPQRVGTFGSANTLQWSPDGRQLLVVPGDDTMSIVDTINGNVQSLASPNAVLPAFSADGREIVYARDNAQGESDVILRTLATQAERPLALNMAGLNAIAFSPANDSYALAYASQVQVFDLEGFSPLVQTSFSNQSLVWTAAGRLVAYNGGNGTYFDQSGWFCADNVALGAGANVISAAAIDGQNLRSLDSAPIEIDTPTAGLPDLAIASGDIFFVPPSGSLGQNFSALVVLHNIGTADVAAPTLSATLTAPDGTRQALPPPPLAALAAGGAEQLNFALGTLTQPGNYRLDVTADPDATLREVRVDNNSASATLTVSADGKPVLELNLARSVFAPGDAVSGDVAVTNPGMTFSGKVHLSVLDANDALVADLGDVAVGPLPFGQRFAASVNWNAQGVFAGAYQLRAQLNAADGSAVAQQTDAFSIQSLRHVQLALTPDAPSHALGDSVSVHSGVIFSDGNAPLAGATLNLAAFDVNGNVLWQTQQTLGTLLPGYQLGRDDVWPTGAAGAGVYTLQLSLQAPDLAQSTQASVTLTAAAPTRALAGTLAFDPGTTLIAGGSTVVTYSVHNAGSSALSAVQTRLRIVSGSLAPVSEQDAQYDLAVGGTQAASLTLQAPPLALISHLAILEARLPEDPNGQWRLLAQQGFAVIDALPPVIGVLSPNSSDIQPSIVPFRASILDQHSAVADAEVSVDGGNWQPVSVGADGYYARGLTGIADGDHTLVVRARDTWGNSAQTAPLPFTVDATPPDIEIPNVADGALLNHAVAPIVTITDAHLKSSDVRLNGAPFVSGSNVTTEGTYVLTARASDTAGNVSVKSVRFTLDFSAPSVAIVAPTDGASVAQSSVHVDVQTEAQADVTLATGAFQATATADAQGHAGFDNVPLALGANRLSATATDRAGNVGGPVSVTVTYDPGAIAPLTGTIQPDATIVAYGSTLGVAVSAKNPNATALAAQSLRVRVLDAASTVLATQNVTHDFAAGETYATNLSFDSTGWPLGAITLTLELDQSGSWTLLDSKSATVADLTPPVLALTAPAEGAILHGPSAIAASASDTLSGVASVEASVDTGAWTALASTGANGYASAALALADGDHSVLLRAHDGAGNLATAGPGHFTIDSVPPLIQLAGVAEGDLLNHAVAPTITITDLHPATSDVRLNGQPYVSGTQIAGSGAYTLSASATDAAGNSSAASVHFTLDLDPPAIVFTAPAQNAIVATATIEVSGTTEAKAHVHLSTGGFSVDMDADGNGTFDVPGVPLAAGANTISARATDIAGNVGPTATLTVSYQVSALSGNFGTVPTTLARGLLLDLPYTLHNTGNVPFTALPLRIEVQPAAGGDPVLSDDFSGDIAAGTAVDGTRQLSTDTLAPGSYNLLLRANLPAAPGPGGWTTLDTRTTTIFLDPCRMSITDRIFADGFEVRTRPVGDDIFCNGFEQLLATASKLLRTDVHGVGASLWASSADALPLLRAIGPRVRFELVAARALSTAKDTGSVEHSDQGTHSAQSARLGHARLADTIPRSPPWPRDDAPLEVEP